MGRLPCLTLKLALILMGSTFAVLSLVLDPQYEKLVCCSKQLDPHAMLPLLAMNYRQGSKSLIVSQFVDARPKTPSTSEVPEVAFVDKPSFFRPLRY